MNRRKFLLSAAATTVIGPSLLGKEKKEDFLDVWQRETDCVKAPVYCEYMKDGNTRNLASLEKLEQAFEKAVTEARAAKITDTPGVWSIYNMGYIVKTREAFFAIDLIHRRALELADELDFLLVTHDHTDHFNLELYNKLNNTPKTVISNFKDNYRAFYSKGKVVGGFTRAEKVFKIKDCEIHTSLVDHHRYLIDFTTAFEIKVGNWTMYHTGDCGIATKLKTVWGRPDLWTFFPGCGVNVADAVKKIKPKKLVFGHLWELAHSWGRLTTPLIRRAITKARSQGFEPKVALWGERIS